jgi:hypothetical protein
MARWKGLDFQESPESGFEHSFLLAGTEEKRSWFRSEEEVQMRRITTKSFASFTTLHQQPVLKPSLTVILEVNTFPTSQG